MQGFGFGAPATGASGFGAPSTGAGGFGAPSTGASGFGAPSASTGGGFGSGFGATKTPGLGGFGGGSSASFGISGFGAAPGVTGQQGMASLLPYKGVKGPGASSEWARGVDFGSFRDDTLFEQLPPMVQQHLAELHAFIREEHQARDVLHALLRGASLGLIDPRSVADSSSVAAAKPSVKEGDSLRALTSKLDALVTGSDAIDCLAVEGAAQKKRAKAAMEDLSVLQEEFSEYSKVVWGPIADQGEAYLSHLTASATSSTPGHRGRPLGPMLNSSHFFVSSVSWLEEQMNKFSAILEELELAAIPHVNRRPSQAGNPTEANGSHSGGALDSLAVLSGLEGRGANATSGADRDEYAGGAPAGRAAEITAQIIAALNFELRTLLSIGGWVSRLHSRCQTAREVFTHQFGEAVGRTLFASSRSSRGRPGPSVNIVKEHATLGEIQKRSHAHRSVVGSRLRMCYDLQVARDFQQKQSGAAGQTQAVAPLTGGNATAGTGSVAAPPTASTTAITPAASIPATTTTASTITNNTPAATSAARTAGSSASTTFGGPTTTASTGFTLGASGGTSGASGSAAAALFRSSGGPSTKLAGATPATAAPGQVETLGDERVARKTKR